MLIGKLHVDKILTQFALGYKPSGFLPADFLAIVNVDKQTDIYDVWDQGDLFRDEQDRRTPGTAPSQIRLRVGSETFRCENYELAAETISEDAANADPSRRVMLESGKVGATIDKLLLGEEKRWAELLFTTGNIGSSAAVVSVWTGAGADPVGDIFTAIDNVQHATGYRPNKMLIGVKPYNALKRHATVIDKSVNPNVTGGAGFASVEQIKQVFEFDQINVGMTYRNASAEGIAQSVVPVWSNHCLVYYDPPGSMITQPRFAARFNWTGAPTQRLQVVRHQFDSLRKKQNMSVGMYQDEKITSAPLGFILTAATTN